MTKDTESAGMIEIDGKILKKKTTTSLPERTLDGLKAIRIVEREPPYSVIDRLLEEHDIKTMQKAVAKRVR